jgi:CO/xanthine dehydrogenase Mo-binding subunit
VSEQRPIEIVDNIIGADVPRVDGRLKVTGRARYASDTPVANVAVTINRSGFVTVGDGRARYRHRRLHGDRADRS